MSEQTLRLVERLRSRLRDTIRRITLAQAAWGTCIVLGVLAAVWLVAAAVEAGFWLDTTPRTVLITGSAVAVLVVMATFLARPILQLIGLLARPSDEEIARRIGERYPEVSDRLLNLLQLAGGRSSDAPEPMVDAAVRTLGEDVEPVPFEQTEDFTAARRAARMASLPVVGVLAFLLIAPSTFLGASERLLAPRTAFERPAPFTVSVFPGHVGLVRGNSLSVSVRASGEVPERLTLEVRPATEAPPTTISMRPDSNGVFRHTVPGLREDLDYRIRAGRVQTDWYRATVKARPLVRTLRVRVSPPRYTGLPARSLDANVGDVTGLPGSVVELQASLGGPAVDSAALRFDDGSRTSLDVEDGTATGRFRLTGDGHYSLILQSADGVSNRDPIRYRLSLEPDARPSIAFVSPEADAQLEEDLVAQVRLRLRDDFGFSRLRLHYRLAEQRFGSGETSFSSIDLPLDRPSQVDQVVSHEWLLAQESGLDLVPGDVVEYYAEVWDNDGFRGAKSSRSGTQRLRLASLAEKYQNLDDQTQETGDQMESLKQQAEDVERQFQELRDEVKRKRSADWEDRRQLEQLRQKQESIDQGVSDLAQQVEEMTRQMQQNDLTSPETAKKFEELRRVIEEIRSPELKDALRQMQEAMQNLDLRQMQEAMEDFEFNEEQYQQRLDRTLELFKRLKQTQKMEELSRRLGDLGNLEEKLAEETSRRMDSDPAPGEPSDAEDPADAEESTDGESTDGESTEEESADGSAPNESEEASTPDASDPSSSSESPSSESSGSEQETSDQETSSQESANEESANEDLAREQGRAREQMKELMQQMQQLSEEMQSSPRAPNEQMRQMKQQMQQQDLPEQMKRNSEQLRRNQLQDAQSGQQQMQQQLQQMSQKMQQMQQGMSGQQMQINLAGVHAALENTLRLSERQESLRQTIRELSSDSPTLRSYAQDQEQLKSSLRAVSDSLQQLAKQIPQMNRKVQKETGEALRSMDGSTAALSERNAARASGTQKASMTHLNELALLLADLLKQMQNAQGSGGGQSMQQMLQQMQQMSGQQQKLNRQIQQFLNDMQGNRLSVDQKKRLQQMAEQQAEIKRKLDELGRESGLRDDVLGDLDRVAEQMEETIRELQQGRQTSRTVERQKQILTRLLNAQRSLRKQGKDDRRKGQSSDDDVERVSPSELSPEEEIEQLRRDLIRALDSGYAPDYERLIKRYFELLEGRESSRQP